MALVAEMEKIAPHFSLVLGIGFATGLRPSEVYGLRFSDLRVDDNGWGWISVQRRLVVVGGRLVLSDRLKGEPRSSASRRTIPIGPGTVATIEAHRSYYGLGPSGSLWRSPEGDNFDPRNFRIRDLARAITAAKLDEDDDVPVIPYTWRHSHATWLLASGVPPAEAARRLGQASQATLLAWYSHPLPGGDLAAAMAVAPSIAGLVRTQTPSGVSPIFKAKPISPGTT